MKRDDIYDARLGPTEGSEQSGMHPVVIVSRDVINQYSSVIVVAPLTSAANITRHYPTNVNLSAGTAGLTVDSVLLGGQIRAVSKSRLRRLRGALSAEQLAAVDEALRITLDL